MALALFLLWVYVVGVVVFAITGWYIHADFQRTGDRQARAEFND